MTGLGETVVAVATHEASKSLLHYAHERWRARKIWRLCAPENLVVVLSADRAAMTLEQAEDGTGPTLKLRPGAGAAHARAALIAGLSLQNAYGRFSADQVRLSADGSLHEDLVLLGNPDHNVASRDLLHAVRQSYRDVRLKRFECGSLDWQMPEKVERFGGDQPRANIDHDFGVIVRVQNPFAVKKRRRAVLLAGCTTFGTLAAVRVFTELLVKKYAPAMNSRHDFACLVRTSVRENDDTISGVGVIDFQRLYRDES